MAGPRYRVSDREGWNEDTAGVKVDRNPSWCVAFVRFKTPGAMFIGNEDPFAEKKVLVVENDCVAVNVDNSKGSFAKTASITMKIGEIYYKNAVAPGDYVFVWMNGQQDNIDGIINMLMRDPGSATSRIDGFDKKKILNGWSSGLKFFGRVMSVPESDTIQAGGQRMIAQTISCQSFVELASSIYYTFVAQNVLTLDNSIKADVAQTNFFTKEIAKLGANPLKPATSTDQKGASNGLEVALSNLSSAFDNFYRRVDGKEVGDTSPEAIIGLLFIITMGVGNDSINNDVDKAIPGARGTFSDAIGVPKGVAGIFGRRGNKLWQMYNVLLGMQKYKSSSNDPWKRFQPEFTKETAKKDSVFYRTPLRCKGFVPFLVPPIWDNNTFWNVYGQFLNSVVNEMYTCMRVNGDGQILPTLVVREKPFSTNLYNHLMKVAPTFTPKKTRAVAESAGVSGVRKQLSKEESQQVDEYGTTYEQLEKVAPEITQRTMFNEIPRWVIDESVIVSVNTSPNENSRINFVQVWGRSRGVEMLGANINQEILKQAQFLVPNYVCDQGDVKRHGLRADISETNYDVISNTMGTISHIIARQRADWLFNGQLKLNGTITLQGVSEPIVEGDNCEVRGILYHIENVSHSGSLAANGTKVFKTTLTVSNGIVASSLDSAKGIPVYAVGNQALEMTEDMHNVNNLPGFTDIQNTGPRKGRNSDGESTE